MDKLMEKFQNDTSFRQEMAADASAAVRRSGIELTAEEMASIQRMVSSAGEELKPRVSKRPKL
jgi:flagellar biosynthesis/type III secretory pathway M-ring protein FliF/YscJ